MNFARLFDTFTAVSFPCLLLFFHVLLHLDLYNCS